MQTFIIYTPKFDVLGFVEHISGDRAVEKAEETMGRADLVWAAWSDASKTEKSKAVRLGAIT